MSPETLRDLADWIAHIAKHGTDQAQVRRGDRLAKALVEEAERKEAVAVVVTEQQRLDRARGETK